VALFIAGSGHWITGTVTIAGAYALSLLVVERFFLIVKPKLLRLSWFAALWKRFVAVRGTLLGWLGLRNLRDRMAQQPLPRFQPQVTRRQVSRR
jgi:hypothetical protein